jgi:hypothetical protein
MSNIANADIPAQAAALRAELGLDDLIPLQVFAAAVRKSTRTIERAIDRGELRVFMVGHTPHVSKTEARQRYFESLPSPK